MTMGMSSCDISGITVRWIHRDIRGEIFCFYKDGREYTLLTTRKGFARGGCVHPRSTEHAVILKGCVEYYVSYGKGNTAIDLTYKEGDSILPIPPNAPHYLLALEDSMTLEWGAEPEEKAMKHPVWRDVVEEINRRRVKELEDYSSIRNSR